MIINICLVDLTLSHITLKNGQTHFKSFEVTVFNIIHES